jgi:hypothetical protein
LRHSAYKEMFVPGAVSDDYSVLLMIIAYPRRLVRCLIPVLLCNYAILIKRFHLPTYMLSVLF